ncbi:DJ-1/PfpI family protein [Micromonospora citrea]|uniref:DJ-1/PfpI family protein n=1 Tax=Micromonospora citrea TaxID=47855 RepID=A0A1C6VX87_9ACTN|nr:DJ-1/PfpI family protein [Micromonospora citrea]SCL70945.1 DJ-1/PfpI family protein [Micromonospora citrea]
MAATEPVRRRIAHIAVITVAALAVPTAVGTLGVRRAAEEVYPQRVSDVAPPERPAPVLDPGRPTVAVVLGAAGANVADALAPYEVFAATGRFNVVTVAPTSDPVTLTGGLDLVPDLSFAELAARASEPPDVVVVPQLHGPTSDVVDWLRAQRRQGAPLLLSVCVGAEVLADAGLLDGRPATSHWLKLIGLRRSDPDVNWTEGVRFVDDGDIVTTAGVLSGIDGALRVVERLVGPAEAERVSRELGWSGYRPGGPVAIADEDPQPRDLVALLSAAYRWNRPTTGVLLTDGVGEIELAAAFRPYTELSYLARLRAFSLDGRAVRSRHGLTFLPRAAWRPADPGFDRVLVPHGAPPVALGDTSIPVRALHDAGEFPFDGALRDIADTYDVATARWVARSLQYPVPDRGLPGPRWPWLLTVSPLLLAGVGAGTVILAGRVLALRRRDRPGGGATVPAGPTPDSSAPPGRASRRRLRA